MAVRCQIATDDEAPFMLVYDKVTGDVLLIYPALESHDMRAALANRMLKLVDDATPTGPKLRLVVP